MSWDARRTWGRAYSLALWAVGLGTIVEMMCVYALFERALPPLPFAEITGGYMLLLLGVGAGVQLPSAAEKMPGRRIFEPGAPGRVLPDRDIPEAG